MTRNNLECGDLSPLSSRMSSQLGSKAATSRRTPNYPMVFNVNHTTIYRYSEPVYLDPHVIRLRPRADGTQRLIAYQLQIDPEPAGRTDCLDAEGNSVVQAWFAEPTSSLQLSSQFMVETLRDNPFDFLLPPPSHLQLAPAADVSAELAAFAREMAHHSGEQTMTFLELLSERLCRDWHQVIREEGDPLSAEAVLNATDVSCRDLAVLFCGACRAMNLTARFVSGYEVGSATAERGFMHAWAEVLLPGGGWRGYDPSRGVAVGADHVAVAAAAIPAMAAPVSGTYRGSAKSSMEAAIQMQVS
jgi:transglutaminase-like putative cysteine protease